MKLRVFLPSILVAGASSFAVIAWLPNPALESVSGVATRSMPASAVASVTLDRKEHALVEESVSKSSPMLVIPAESQVSDEIEAKEEELRHALTAASQIENTNLRTETVTAVCYRWAEWDPRQALNIALEYELQNAPGAVIENLAQQWAVVDLRGALEWIDSQEPSDLRSELVARTSYVWAGSDPKAAAVFVLDRTKPGPVQAEAIISVLHQWTQRDRIAAREWVGKFPPGELRERALWETEDHSAVMPQ